MGSVEPLTTVGEKLICGNPLKSPVKGFSSGFFELLNKILEKKDNFAADNLKTGEYLGEGWRFHGSAAAFFNGKNPDFCKQ